MHYKFIVFFQSKKYKRFRAFGSLTVAPKAFGSLTVAPFSWYLGCYMCNLVRFFNICTCTYNCTLESSLFVGAQMFVDFVDTFSHKFTFPRTSDSLQYLL